jgi:hypothetical protein
MSVQLRRYRLPRMHGYAKKGPGIAPRAFHSGAGREADVMSKAKAYFASFSISFSTMLAGTSW